MRIELLSLALLLSSGASFAEVPTPPSIWSGLAKAIDSDIFSNASIQRIANRKAQDEAIKMRIDEIKATFSMPYSYQSVDKSLRLMMEILVDPYMNDSQLKEVHDLYNDLYLYEDLSKSVKRSLTLSSESKRFKRVGELLNMKEMAPVYIEWIASDLMAGYEANGLFKIGLDGRYVFLNSKIKYVKDTLDSMKDIKKGDVKEKIQALRDVQKTVNEISPDFPNEKILFDQNFENQ